MNELEFESQVRSIASRMPYPRTPDLAGSVRARLRPDARPRFFSKPFLSAQGRRLAWSLTVVLVLISSLMLIPPARAAILEFIQVGVVRIFRSQPTALPTESPSILTPVTATPVATEQSLIPLLKNVMGETTLDEAQSRVEYSLLLPAYPPDLGRPDYVFVQDADGDMTIMVWLHPEKRDQVRMSLHFLPQGSWAIKKVDPTVIRETRVNGEYAVWAVGPYPMKYDNGRIDFVRLISGHVLVWSDGVVTYRLETDLSMEEAIRVAESLSPLR